MVLATACLTFALAALSLIRPAFIQFLDHHFYDGLARSAPAGRSIAGKPPLIVDIDEASLAEYGQWPWPRYRLAQLLERLRAMGASAVGIDILLSEPDRTSPVVLREAFSRDFGIDLTLPSIPPKLADHDLLLGEVLRCGPFVTAFKFSFVAGLASGKGTLLPHPLTAAVAGPDPIALGESSLPHAKSVVSSLPVLSTSAASSGYINASVDRDGILRRMPLVTEYEGRLYPCLALAAFSLSRNNPPTLLTMGRGGAESLRVGTATVPLDRHGSLLIRYRGPGRTFEYLSAGRILKDEDFTERVKGRIVFLGTSAAGLADMRPSPFDSLLPGVEVHATVADNLMREDFFSHPSWSPAMELLLLLATGGIVIFLFTCTATLWSLACLPAMAAALWLGSLFALHYGGVFISPVMSLFTLACDFSSITLFKYGREAREARARQRQLTLTQDFTIRCLASLAECWDSETGGHILRTQRYVDLICRRLAEKDGYGRHLGPETIEQLYKSSPLHDIGKVGVPDHILLKPGKLTEEEFEEMKKHTVYGRDAIRRAEEKFGTGTSSHFLLLAKEMAYSRHERWDGTGYPEHLRGEEIPLSGRIMAIADVYDALVSYRVYKPPFSHEEAVAMILGLKGSLFDPAIVAAFLESEEQFRKIAAELSDDSAD
jgi:adenylate cyclase